MSCSFLLLGEELGDLSLSKHYFNCMRVSTPWLTSTLANHAPPHPEPKEQTAA